MGSSLKTDAPYTVKCDQENCRLINVSPKKPGYCVIDRYNINMPTQLFSKIAYRYAKD